jgi:hypothetical protein
MGEWDEAENQVGRGSDVDLRAKTEMENNNFERVLDSNVYKLTENYRTILQKAHVSLVS